MRGGTQSVREYTHHLCCASSCIFHFIFNWFWIGRFFLFHFLSNFSFKFTYADSTLLKLKHAYLQEFKVLQYFTLFFIMQEAWSASTLLLYYCHNLVLFNPTRLYYCCFMQPFISLHVLFHQKLLSSSSFLLSVIFDRNIFVRPGRWQTFLHENVFTSSFFLNTLSLNMEICIGRFLVIIRSLHYFCSFWRCDLTCF